MPMVEGEVASHESEFYITECTWMRKHGWRTPHWKLIVALEPDFHFKPTIELYNLIEDPDENNNLAETRPDVVTTLQDRMRAWIAKREKETGLKNPMMTQGAWVEDAPFKTSQHAYDTLHIGDPGQAERLQAKKSAITGFGSEINSWEEIVDRGGCPYNQVYRKREIGISYNHRGFTNYGRNALGVRCIIERDNGT